MTCGDIDLRCARCRLSKCRTKVVPGTGPSSSRIAFVGEAPGKDEDLAGVPFVGRAGKILDQALLAAGVDRGDVFITNMVKCRPPGNRRPRRDEVQKCSKFLESELQRVSPEVVCALGSTAASHLGRPVKRMSETVGKKSKLMIGKREVSLVVAYHPAACLYQRKNLRKFNESVRKAVELAGTP